jgi:hypothetical protein
MTHIIKKYPSCYKSLSKLIGSNENYKNIYSLLNPVIFDTTLRDGLQNIKQSELNNYSTQNKLELYNKIKAKHKPEFVEVGSLVSKKYFPIFSDSIEIFTQTNNNTIGKNFLLIPSMSKLKLAINSGCNNFSFISSVSESFQLANTNKSIQQTKAEILEMMYEIVSNPITSNPQVKIYLSCIDHCPKEGKISPDLIADEIIYYNDVSKPDIICLSDTCGSLTHESFIDIVDKANKGGVPYQKLSLHLHIDNSSPNYYSNLQKIFNASMDRKITQWDLSLLETGGCVMTLDNSNIKPNLSYQLYYRLLIDYIVYKC